MIKLLKDKAKTRILLKAVTSYAPDYKVNYSNNSKTDTLILSIGSAVIELLYNSLEDRDSDVKDLDRIFEELV